MNTMSFRSSGNDYALSISDLMAGLLFVFIIALVIFAIVLNTLIEQKKEELYQMTNARQIRDEMLYSLQNSLREYGINVIIDLENGILRIPEKVLFRSGSATLDEDGMQSMTVVAMVLDSLLPEYAYIMDSNGVIIDKSNNTKKKLEAILVEGHTDNVPLVAGAPFKDNWDLSASRAITTFQSILKVRPRLDSLLNAKNQKIFSVSGYADCRPVEDNMDEAGRAANRRIDLRFLMMPPDTLVVKR